MIENIALEIATLQDIESVLLLQELYLVSNLTEEEKKAGFVTTPFTVAQLTEVMANQGLFIAKDGNKVIAYIFAESWTFFNQWPIFTYMCTLFPTLSFEYFKIITTTNSFQYGPICIHADYRGKGLIRPLFELMRSNMVTKFSLGLTFINKKNIPSLKAHTEKLNWTIIGEFQFNNNEYNILAYDMNKAI
ncbi:GNAT family N-acetyltransferase [Flavobacterium frigoris]|uniref:GNAT family acetyltransferase n=1 Tax=Flavobacterium frigoris TaxID=229204 RepID=A0A1H9R755_FLAFI|nr:GNAT family acetyltransferase [Flavobacterium frigoris]SER67773.1 hypothetical protein SAMN05444355_11920 [Flavobacterium frigoris]